MLANFIFFSDLSYLPIPPFFSAAISAGFNPTTSNARLITELNHPPTSHGRFPRSIITFELYEYPHTPHLDTDLSQDISPYIWTLPDELAASPSPPANMILVSKYLPWRIHISPNSVRDLIVAVYTALRMRVTGKELKTVGGKDAMTAFAKRVQGMGEEERRKGVRRVDFLLGYTRFVGIEPTDEPGVWNICFDSTVVVLLQSLFP